MRWEDRRESDNVEDRRGRSPRGVAIGGGMGAIVLAIIIMLMGGDPSQLLGGLQGGTAPGTQGSVEAPANDPGKKFASVILADTEEVWTKVFREQLGEQYVEPKLVIFTGQVDFESGRADSGMGPFYCGADQNVYIDLSFYQTMADQLGAPGDFAQAYVIAHEVGHHVQKLLGTLDKVNNARRQSSERQATELSVRLELQADFYAGLWAHHAQHLTQMDEQDLREALNAAKQIGDDALQKRQQGYVVPHAFTHGTSEQRMKWFLAGYRSGRVKDGDTFSLRNP